jgi:hypothetical protein
MMMQRRETKRAALRILCAGGLLLLGAVLVVHAGWHRQAAQVLETRTWWELTALASAQGDKMMQSLAGLHGGQGAPLSLRSLLVNSIARNKQSATDKVADMSNKIKKVETERRKSKSLFKGQRVFLS